ncbi:MAG TPA: hypothetical protein VK879_14725 [Candidatus Sulfomarinibacteraceae bacterium]|nr:hypothetical protein [Candidatus Sulfomarinibacteraceae bacterium]
MIDHAAAGDGKQLGSRFTLLLVLIQSFQRLGKHLLGQILGVCTIANAAVDVAVDGRHVLAVEGDKA